MKTGLDLEKSCKGSTQSMNKLDTLFSTPLRHIRVVSLSKINETMICALPPKLFCKCTQISLAFTSCPFSVPDSHRGHHVTVCCHVSLGSSDCDSFSDFPLILMTGSVLRRTGWVFWSKVWFFSGFFQDFLFDWLNDWLIDLLLYLAV